MTLLKAYYNYLVAMKSKAPESGSLLFFKEDFVKGVAQIICSEDRDPEAVLEKLKQRHKELQENDVSLDQSANQGTLFGVMLYCLGKPEYMEWVEEKE